MPCWAALAAIGVAACDHGENKAPDDSSGGRAAVRAPREPRRVAAQDRALRTMIAEITATRACERLRGMFRPIGGEQGSPVTGVAWIQECDAASDGTEITLQLAGRGWRWVARDSEAAGADFSVDTYVRFTFSIETHGETDVAYAPEQHIFTLWFTPDARPKTTFEPIGEVEVDEEGLWASVVGGVASVFASSPEERAGTEVSKQGRQQFAKQFAKGLAVTIDLCNGNVRSALGHPDRGEMIGPQQTEHRQSAELHPGGLVLDGPVLLPQGGLDTSSHADAFESRLVCADDAAKLAKAFLDQRPLPDVPAAGKDAGCPLVHVLRARDGLDDVVHAEYSVTEVVARVPELATCRRRASRH